MKIEELKNIKRMDSVISVKKEIVDEKKRENEKKNDIINNNKINLLEEKEKNNNSFLFFHNNSSESLDKKFSNNEKNNLSTLRNSSIEEIKYPHKAIRNNSSQRNKTSLFLSSFKKKNKSIIIKVI